MSVDSDQRTALDELRDRYRKLRDRIESNQSEFSRLARSVYRVQEEERRRIAREMHDGIGQNLTVLMHRIRAAAEQRDDDSIATLHGALELCERTLADTRELCRILRPQILDDLGLTAALHSLVQHLSESAGLQVDVEVADVSELDGDVQMLVYRLAQESLTNILRHARARSAQVKVSRRPGVVQLLVSDDGDGFDPTDGTRPNGSGLGGMRERVKLFGGIFDIDSRPGEGCRVRAAIPLSLPGEDA
jgi:signal transduction histidine kinase